MPRGQVSAFREGLSQGTFDFRQVPHALLSVKGEGVVATLYASGKLVVQGPAPELFVARFTEIEAVEGAVAAKPEREAPESLTRIDGPLIGSDETGKGDYFGPLVVAAVRIDPDEAARLSELGVTDSKKVADKKALRIAGWLRDNAEHAFERLDPPAYNARYAASTSGLNPILAAMHAAAIRELAAGHAGIRVVVDQFAGKALMQKALAGVSISLEQAHRAEANVAVAAASILARAEFLLALEELEGAFEVELHKGAGELVDAAGARFVARHGSEALERVAKLHFKNTAKIAARIERGG